MSSRFPVPSRGMEKRVVLASSSPNSCWHLWAFGHVPQFCLQGSNGILSWLCLPLVGQRRFAFGDELENLRSFPYSRFTNTATKTPPLFFLSTFQDAEPGIFRCNYSMYLVLQREKNYICFRKHSNFLLIESIEIIKLKWTLLIWKSWRMVA